MGKVRTLKQNAAVQEAIQLRHLGRSLWTALEKYVDPENWIIVGGAYTWNGQGDPGAIAREALGLDHEFGGEKLSIVAATPESRRCLKCGELVSSTSKMSLCLGEKEVLA